MREGLSKYEYGQVSLLSEDEERIRKQAIAEGKDPGEALRAEMERMAKATSRIQEAGEQARLKKGRLLKGKFGKEGE